jgi:DNA-binding NtrC family response regulator
MARTAGDNFFPPDAVPTASPADDAIGRSLRIPAKQWLPHGPSPRAVRLLRPGRTAAVVPLVAGRWYLVGRSEKADFWFENEGVSRQHGLLFFAPEVSRWVLRDNESAHGTLLLRGDASGSSRRVPHGVPIGLAAGQTVQLGANPNHLEFLEEMPATTESAPDTQWKAPATQELERSIRRASRFDRPVFLLGASGTGKMYAAHLIHELSGAAGRFVYVNCGSLPGDRPALHSELLGHVRGAFTGATDKRIGKLFEADGGTLFLDEVESLVPEAQVFLLDLLEEGNEELTPLGAPSSRGLPRPRFRLISASKQPLAESPLRRDLAQRLARGELIRLPSLRERREDVPALVGQFLTGLAAGNHHITAAVSEKALAFLTEQPWPGEVRELQATVETVASRVAERLADSVEPSRLILGLEDFKEYLQARTVAFGGRPQAFTADETAGGFTVVPGLRKRPSDLTRADVEAALRATNNNKTHAARTLGVALNTLKRKMEELGLLGVTV